MILPPQKIIIAQSNIHGWGVFAKEIIREEEIIEETPFIHLFKKGEEDLKINKNMLIDYRFSFPASINWQQQVIPMGYGCVYNHSDNPNARWETFEETNIFKFIALRDIAIGEEICTYYGPAYYWNNGREHIDVK